MKKYTIGKEKDGVIPVQYMSPLKGKYVWCGTIRKDLRTFKLRSYLNFKDTEMDKCLMESDKIKTFFSAKSKSRKSLRKVSRWGISIDLIRKLLISNDVRLINIIDKDEDVLYFCRVARFLKYGVMHNLSTDDTQLFLDFDGFHKVKRNLLVKYDKNKYRQSTSDGYIDWERDIFGRPQLGY